MCIRDSGIRVALGVASIDQSSAFTASAEIVANCVAVIAEESGMTATGGMTLSGSATILAISSINALGSLKWEDQTVATTSYTDVTPATTTWAPVNNESETWTDIAA